MAKIKKEGPEDTQHGNSKEAEEYRILHYSNKVPFNRPEEGTLEPRNRVSKLDPIGQSVIAGQGEANRNKHNKQNTESINQTFQLMKMVFKLTKQKMT